MRSWADKSIREAVKFLLSASLVIVLSCLAHAIDWPVHYAVVENSTSPNGQYGILALAQRHASSDEEKYEKVAGLNYLADLKSHAILGSLKGPIDVM